MGISIWQVLIVLLIVLLVFGSKKITNLGSDLGKALKGFKKEIKNDSNKDDSDRTSWTPLLAVIAITASNPKSLISTLRGFIKNFLQIKKDINIAKEKLENELRVTEIKQDIHNEEILKNIEDDGKQ